MPKYEIMNGKQWNNIAVITSNHSHQLHMVLTVVLAMLLFLDFLPLHRASPVQVIARGLAEVKALQDFYLNFTSFFSFMHFLFIKNYLQVKKAEGIHL